MNNLDVFSVGQIVYIISSKEWRILERQDKDGDWYTSDQDGEIPLPFGTFRALTQEERLDRRKAKASEGVLDEISSCPSRRIADAMRGKEQLC
jgi:hypothetical protein